MADEDGYGCGPINSGSAKKKIRRKKDEAIKKNLVDFIKV
jgi:hypothetical protein